MDRLFGSIAPFITVRYDSRVANPVYLAFGIANAEQRGTKNFYL